VGGGTASLTKLGDLSKSVEDSGNVHVERISNASFFIVEMWLSDNTTERYSFILPNTPDKVQRTYRVGCGQGPGNRNVAATIMVDYSGYNTKTIGIWDWYSQGTQADSSKLRGAVYYI
jgi:hypothetical protein